ncbi:hypothetical protein COU76_01390 [Candidatus Peregrinibacteria bacterium CG10_big_fil_rev_8_21_14_0_10_49_10]|nr:MAG: hypothetical protein COU76_01390 [Candidatus Peregrinibacteria bacterium CG10_big_fil_rev_8_21_14_0_10_49_10]
MAKITWFLGMLAALLFPIGMAFAQEDFELGSLDGCPLSSIGELGCPNNASDYIMTVAVSGNNSVLKIFMGVLFAMLIYYGIKLLLNSRDENSITETKVAYGQAVVGAMLVGGATLLADTFASKGSAELVNEGGFNSLIGNVILFLKALLVTVVIVNIVIQGIRLIVEVDENTIETAKKHLLQSLIGAAMVILASTVVDAFYTSRAPSNLTVEIVGIAKYALTVFGALAVIGLVTAGIFLVFSVDESLKDRARKLILTCVIALTVVIASYGLVTIFV